MVRRLPNILGTERRIDSASRLLLKYTSRDEVDLLESGSGGLPETRRAIEGYEEKSPLYGLVVHRRKKVLLKYVPEGTSRLLQGKRDIYVPVPVVDRGHTDDEV